MKKLLFILLIVSTYAIGQTHDVRLDNQIIQVVTDDTIVNIAFFENVRVETNQPIKVGNTLGDFVASDAPELPNEGQLLKNQIFSYNGQLVMVRQDHNRTIYPPEETPALFSFYRENSDTLSWISGEIVEVGWIRVYNGTSYEVIQRHMTQDIWTPDAVPALWTIYAGECPEWVQPTGSQDAYNIGDCVTFEGNQYESLINGNVWSPTVYPAGWQQI